MIIYTASDQSYADSVIGYIDPMKSYFKYRLYRHNCVKIISDNGPLYVKDLRIIKNCPLTNMVIIDNSCLSFAFHLDNGIPILPYYSNKDDNEMIFLKNYLAKLSKYDNIPFHNGPKFNLLGLLEESIKMEETNSNYEIDEVELEEYLKSPSLKTVSVNGSGNELGNPKKSIGKIDDFISSVNKKTTSKALTRSKKVENLEVLNGEKKPIRRKSQMQAKIYVSLKNAKKDDS